MDSFFLSYPGGSKEAARPFVIAGLEFLQKPE
jgi:hypothetical protein